jgi:phospholipid-binding lipoprotein MlaA
MQERRTLRRKSRFNAMRFRVILVTVVLMTLGGTVTTALADPAPIEVSDPWEGMNRGFFAFNEGADRWVFEPIAKGWDFVMPDPVERSLARLFENAYFPVRFVNDVLQAKPVAATEDLGRFVINSTIGLAGLFDPATKFGINGHREDFGQTLGYWGIPPGPYFVIPVLGPSNVRDAFARIGDAAAQPQTYLLPFWATMSIQTVDYLNWRSLNLDEIASARESALDFYVFQRNAYMQYRENQVHDREAASDEADDGDDLYYPIQ